MSARGLYLARAVELARRGLGNVSPNPPVGAVIVAADGTTIGEGFHHARGGPHAEVEALRDAAGRGADPRGATMYVSLEPCDHHGRTPPCSEAVVAAGLARVVVGTLDPNPRTAGGGVARLRAAGVATEVIEDAAARELIAPFACRMRRGRVFVTLKMAASLNGAIAARPGREWLTGEAARRHVRALRAEHDAVMVGAGTARVDAPRLTLRPPRTRVRPLARVVVCGATPSSADLALFAPDPTAPTLLCVPETAYARHTRAFAARGHVEIAAVPENGAGGVDCLELTRLLARRELCAVLCEGGPTLAAALLAANCVDRLEWLIAPTLIATETAVPALQGRAGVRRIARMRAMTLGEDLRIRADVEYDDV